MEEQNKKIIVDLDANTQEFDKKMQESLAKLRDFEEELPKFENLLKSLGGSFKSFGGENFDWTDLINKNGREAIVVTTRVFEDFFEEIKKVQIKGLRGLELNGTQVKLFDFEKMFPMSALDKRIAELFEVSPAVDASIAYAFEAMGIRVLTGVANLQKKFDSIKIQFDPFQLNSPQNQQAIEAFFKKLEVDFDKKVKNNSTFDTIKELVGAGLKNSLNLGNTLPQTLENSKTALTSFWNSYAYIFENSKSTAKVADRIIKSMSEGKTFDGALAGVSDQLKKSIEFWTPIFSASIKFLGDTLTLGFTSIFLDLFGRDDLKPDFGKEFKKLLGGLLSSLGDMLTQQASKMLLAQTAITKAMALVGTPAGWVAIAALFTLGAALKGAGSAMTKVANAPPKTNGMAGDNGMMTTGQNMAPSYAMQRQSSQQTTNESVLRGGDVYWSSQRYEVIRNF